MSKKVFSIVIVIVACVITSIIAVNIKSTLKIRRAKSSVETVVKPTSINMLIDNSMSDFEQTKKFDKEMEAFIRRWELKGGSFALMKGDRLLYAKGYGYSNTTDTIRSEVSNVYRVASVSKLITATAVMKLAEQKRLSLNSQVFGEEGILCDSMFLDLRYKNLTQITVEHLLCHMSGFSSPYGDPAFSNYSIARLLGKELPLTTNDMVLYATQNRLRSRPGGSYDYSNLGYIVLEKVIESVTELDYQTYVQDSILAPIGCYDMFIGESFSEDQAANEANYYEVKEAEEVEAYDGSGRMTMKSDGGNNIKLLGGAGGWVASPVEILRFVASINGEGNKADILSKKSVATMTRNSKREKPIGWATIRNGGEWLRSGSMAGTSALVKRQKDGYTWVFVSNSSAWIGPKLSSYISSHITRAVSKVSEWPDRDLFEIVEQSERE